MKHCKILLFVVFALIAQLCHGQEKYTLRGELPDNSLDGEFILLQDASALVDEQVRMKQAFTERDSILVVGKEFYYEGTISKAPFLARIIAKDYRTFLVVEPGDIHLRITDWKYEGRVWGTPINDDYNTCIVEKSNQVKAIRDNREKAHLRNFFLSAQESSWENELVFLEKYAKYPDVVRSKLMRYIGPYTKEAALAKYLHIVNLMPKTDRDILLAWRDYKMKEIEYFDKTKALRDSLRDNKPRFIEADPNNLQNISQ